MFSLFRKMQEMNEQDGFYVPQLFDEVACSRCRLWFSRDIQSLTNESCKSTSFGFDRSQFYFHFMVLGM